MKVQTTPNLLPEVKNFLLNQPLKALIGGRDVASSNGEVFETRDPGSGETLASVYHMQPDDVERAVIAASKAFKESGWAQLATNERGVHLHRLADEVERRKAVIGQIEALDCGKILWQAEADVQNFVDTVRYFADLALNFQSRTALAVKGHEATISRHPWGVCGYIIPWNFPILLAGWGIAPALAAGNTVIIKPAEDTPLSTLYMARVAREVGIPDGVINVLPGYGEVTGAALANHPGLKRMSFTGSPEVGRLVAESCGRNLVPVKLELGGKGAAVVFSDVDVAATSQKLVDAITFHTGQVCCDATRWLIHKPIYNEFVEECVNRLNNVRIGHQMDGMTQMGPVVNAQQHKRVPPRKAFFEL